MTEAILRTLEEIERQNNIKILYAVESGSRAWGFASPDSDYDVRYIFVRPLRDYLRIDPLKDTIQGPLDEVLDFSGWDLRKALFLLRKTNPSLMEWIRSPIVYRTTPVWEQLAPHFPEFFVPCFNMQHYYAMLANNWKACAHGDQVKLKRYLYALRPLLCCHWLERFGSAPPVLFEQLCQAVLPQELESTVADLLAQKRAAGEKDLTDRNPQLDAFILRELPRLQEVRTHMPFVEMAGFEKLNALFYSVLEQEEWL